ncbi:hypothetical protein KUV39_05825 [Phaeobacter italicus]|uniref:hypothetical protein n=1 Tax=Phaeobacter italicus TaxID=481446 RepID=UPI001C9737F8|nr:hypothetical protein [Phaeobacter italicus]MBY5976153.1 hypothetical protein [Phaeobacter italicus]
MEGLEVSFVSNNSLEYSGRIDAEYYRKEFLELEEAVLSRNGVELGSLADFLIGPFGSAFTVDNYTDDASYRYIRGKDVKPLTLMDNDNVFMPETDYYRLRRYALREDDVMVSVVGTLGNAALVTPKDLPAVFSCKSSVVRPDSLNPVYLTAYLNCRYGRGLLLRKERGAIQKGLNLDDLRDVLVFEPSEGSQINIERAFRAALSLQERSKSLLGAAEKKLLDALGLADWTPPEPLTYTARAENVFASGRFDARFFAPRIQVLLDLISVDGRTVGDVAAQRRERFRPAKCVDFHYIEIGGIDGAGAATSTHLACSEAPSRATWHVRPDDIITSTVRPIRRLSAQIAPEQDGYVCSSGFVVVQPQDIAPEVLLTYLRLPVICELLDLFASASMYPAITDADIFNLPLPNIPNEVTEEVTRNVQEAKAAKASAANMLEAAKRAVEIAIEDGEPAAMAFLDQAEEAI